MTIILGFFSAQFYWVLKLIACYTKMIVKMRIVLEDKQTRETKEYESIKDAMKALCLSYKDLKKVYIVHRKYPRGYWESVLLETDDCLIQDEV